MTPASWVQPNPRPLGARALLVGESNPYSRDPACALLPWPPASAGARLLGLLGWSEAEYLASFWRSNLVNGEGWSAPRVRGAAAVLMVEASEYGVDVVLLGGRVAGAFSQAAANMMRNLGVEAAGRPLETWERSGSILRVPHPSGLCREWNHPGARDRLRRLLEPYRRAPSVVIHKGTAVGKTEEAW